MAPLPTKPTIMAKEGEGKTEEEKEEKEEDEQKLKEKKTEGALVLVEQPMKKGGNCGMLGPGLIDVFLRLGFLKVAFICVSLNYVVV